MSIIENTSGLTDEKVLEVLRGGVELTFAEFTFVVEPRGIENAIAIVQQYDPETRKALRGSITNTLNRFAKRMRKGIATPDERDAAATDMMFLYAIDRLT